MLRRSSQYADAPAELMWRGDDPDAGRAKMRSNRVTPADSALPQAQEMSHRTTLNCTEN